MKNQPETDTFVYCFPFVLDCVLFALVSAVLTLVVEPVFGQSLMVLVLSTAPQSWPKSRKLTTRKITPPSTKEKLIQMFFSRNPS